MKFNGLTDKRNVFLLLGCYCNNPSLFNQEEFKTNKYDNVSGNNEHIERKHFLNMLQPLNSSKIYAHTFIRGIATI